MFRPVLRQYHDTYTTNIRHLHDINYKLVYFNAKNGTNSIEIRLFLNHCDIYTTNTRQII